jgi:hypothetical protein
MLDNRLMCYGSIDLGNPSQCRSMNEDCDSQPDYDASDTHGSQNCYSWLLHMFVPSFPLCKFAIFDTAE